MNEKEINIDYIGVVKGNNGEYKFEQIPIIKSLEIKEQLRAMCENPNRTLLDLQEAFAMKFRTDKKAYNCCLPYAYSSAYIDYVCYPQFKTYEVYQADKQARIAEIREAVKKESFVSESEKTQKIEERTAQYERQLKDEFLRAALRYIETMDFIATQARVKTMDAVKMSSHEVIGWSTMEYRINEDLMINVLTNFGYGVSSYFFVKVCYKGIDLLPYAQTVNYYYANMQDIIAHTRSYRAARDSWQIALDFVVRLSNQTRVGLERFAYEWISNEITEMITGLKNIKQDSKKILAEIANNRIRDLVSVRSMSEQEVAQFKVYPQELALLFKVEKISNALSLLKKLEQAAAIYPDAPRAIQTIKELNQSIVPEIPQAIEGINHQIGSLQEKIKPKDIELANACAQKKELDEQANAVYMELLKQNPTLKWDMFETDYSKQHPELPKLKNKIKQLTDELQKLKTEIYDRQNFIDRLQKCYTNIADAGLLAA